MELYAGKYEIRNKIGVGGMAHVYHARYYAENKFVQDVALKRLLPAWSDNQHFTNLFLDEATLLCSLHHRNIVSLYDYGSYDHECYFVMEYIDGLDLSQLCHELTKKNIKLPLGLALYITTEVLAALDYAHTAKNKDGISLDLIHRDISPSNILLSWKGDVKLSDFGIAKGRHRSEVTQGNALKGKYAYMSPEHIQGKEIGQESDIFSCGLLFYELLFGKSLFSQMNDLQIMQTLSQDLFPLPQLSSLPPEVQTMLYLSLAYKPESRYESASAWLEDIFRYHAVKGILYTSEDLFAFLQQHCVHLKRQELEEGQTTLVKEAKTRTFLPAQNKYVVQKKKKFYAVLLWILSLSCFADATMISSHHSLASRSTLEKPVHSFWKKNEQQIVTSETNQIDPSAEKNLVPLRLQIQPWGYVSIPGVVARREAPFNISLQQKEYVVSFFYPPQKKWLKKTIDLTNLKQRHCVASFLKKAHVRCF
ncbi:MAG: hypothetical protein COX62_01140 [Deltaproteobacteria bacterium CG_4_10_14_0_2_um_filter_43_8]|nr:MAG: hypothetical protein COV43_04620 [Deltaproteobacteria bacterium CG11_big_fil_rev_8_21_14_0_20_42_23]PJA21909.1 MAG: hypothetical protein COX62_01140 [Deltaproteobacteria bacterium CG_4_10_14_0_2_um_filter_43_8]PJC65059.1 MAG: hypothetical protein CO021_01010 [Deltaproteobacteria bacterium CG_4_9_14_0_2_um_filter_42_21]